MVEKVKRFSRRQRSNMVRAEWQHLFKNKILLAGGNFIYSDYVQRFFLGVDLGSVRANQKLASGVC